MFSEISDRCRLITSRIDVSIINHLKPSIPKMKSLAAKVSFRQIFTEISSYVRTTTLTGDLTQDHRPHRESDEPQPPEKRIYFEAERRTIADRDRIDVHRATFAS